jgi:multidrug efflux system membrane fusion protein
MEKLLSRFGGRRFFVIASLVTVAVASIYYATDGNVSHAEVPANTAIPVVVRTLVEKKIRIWSDFSGRLQAVDAAEVRPEVSGRIVAVHFEDGQLVRAGDVLFIIDPRPYEAAVAKAEADLASARANADFAKLEFDRAAEMIKSEAIAQRLYDERANSSHTTVASVKAAKAELAQAKLDLDYAYVKAPITGRASRAEITVGNLVQAGSNAPLLTTVVSNHGIYADFEVDEQTYLQSIHMFAHGGGQERLIPVRVTVQGDEGHPYLGTIYSFDNRIDASTGTIRARAKFDNADGTLVPGMFVSVSLASSNENNVLLIPDQAIGFDQSKKFVYVVTRDNTVAYREVKVGQEVQAQHIALEGLQAGDRVIIDGVQRVKPGALVEAKEEIVSVGNAPRVATTFNATSAQR